MTIKEFHDSIRELANIGQSQYFTPEVLDGFINDAVTDMFRQEYRHFEATQEISDTLGYYKVESSPLALDESSQAVLPANLYHITALEGILTDTKRASCEQLTDSEFLGRKHSFAFAPSLLYPIARLIGSSKIEALPVQVKEGAEVTTEGVTKLVVFYLREPATAKFGYTVNSEGTGWVYKASTSTQVDWPKISHTAIRDKAIGLVGTTLRDRTLIQNESVRKNQNEEK